MLLMGRCGGGRGRAAAAAHNKKATPKKGKEESRLLGRAPELERFTRFRRKRKEENRALFRQHFGLKKGSKLFFVGAAMSDTFLLVNDSFVHFYPSFFGRFPVGTWLIGGGLAPTGLRNFLQDS